MKQWKRLVSVCTFLVFLPLGSAFAGPLDERVAALEALVATLSSKLATVEGNPVLDLGPYVRVDQNELIGVKGPNLIIEGANLHVRSGAGSTRDCIWDETYCVPSGLGNLIIGYNEVPDSSLAPGDRGGSHNLIMGREHKYRSMGGFIHGWGSTLGAEFAAVLGGDGSYVNGDYSVVVGGINNVISRPGVIVGGEYNTINGTYSAILGGKYNVTSGDNATVTGGSGNVASGNWSSVSGGNEVQAVNDYSWAAGTLSE